MKPRILIVGNPGAVHIGAHLKGAAESLEITQKFLNSNKAFEGPLWLQKVNWWFRNHRPSRLENFSSEVAELCKIFQPAVLLTTGLAPVESSALDKIGKLGLKRLSYLTDDPWNPAHKAGWFLKALPFYDAVFSVRRANLEDLKKAGCKKVFYLPFAYAPHLHYPEVFENSGEKNRFESDVLFIGGADRDRLPYLQALADAGIKLAVYGGYWNRFPRFKKYYRGYADPVTLRKATATAKISLGLVRRANRDGNSMRTFEIPAMGGCMLTEDTEEHREIFGEEGKAVLYFKTADQMISKAKFLLADDAERRRLAQSGHQLITQGRHTYKDRLLTMLSIFS